MKYGKKLNLKGVLSIKVVKMIEVKILISCNYCTNILMLIKLLTITIFISTVPIYLIIIIFLWIMN